MLASIKRLLSSPKFEISASGPNSRTLWFLLRDNGNALLVKFLRGSLALFKEQLATKHC